MTANTGRGKRSLNSSGVCSSNIQRSRSSVLRCLSSSCRPFIFEPGEHPSSEIKETGPREWSNNKQVQLVSKRGRRRRREGGSCVNIPSSFSPFLPPRAYQEPVSNFSSNQYPRRSSSFTVARFLAELVGSKRVIDGSFFFFFSNWRNRALRRCGESGERILPGTHSNKYASSQRSALKF